MSVLSIICDNCGAKYRLPESFSSDKAKCKNCQGVIDVAAQRNKPEKQAGAERKPAAAARPARARPAAASKPAAERAQPSAGRRAGGAGQRRRAAADDDTGSSGGRRRGRRDAQSEQPKKNNSMLIWGGVAALVVIGVVVALMWPEDKKATPAGDEVAQNSGQAAANNAPGAEPKQPATNANSQGNAGKPADAAGSGSGEGGGSSGAAQAPDGSTDKPAEEPTANAADAAKDQPDAASAAKPKADQAGGLSESPNDGNTERWMKNKTSSMAEVLDTTTLGDVTWPDSATPEIQAEIYGLLDSISDGGLPGIRAKPKLEKIGYFAIFGIIDRLRKLNYTDADDNMTAWELNKVLETITAGLNTGFAAVNVGEDLDPRKADYNAKTTRAWTKLIDNPQLADKKSFDAWRKKRLQDNKNKK
ncbi:MAG: hypothetical protein VYE77_01800, partial [Planctomycetota bacterium]|nr:hypothetical protein [Planctomycetota bacterium]